MTPEGKVKAKISKTLKEFAPDVSYDMPVPCGYGKQGVDYNGVVKSALHKQGLAFFIEAKAPGKKPTPRQRNTLAEKEGAGAKCFVIDGDKGVADLRNWLLSITGR